LVINNISNDENFVLLAIYDKKYTAKFCYIEKYAFLCGANKIIGGQTPMSSIIGVIFLPIHTSSIIN
jgi:hypothetical protein